MSKRDILIISIIVVVSILGIWGLLTLWENHENKNYKIQSKQCNELGVEVINKRPGYTWEQGCFDVKDNVVTKYWIVKVNDNYYLREKQ